MSAKQALAGALHLFVVFVFFSAGLFLVSLPFLPEAREKLVHFFSGNPENCTLAGLMLFAVALLLLFGFYAVAPARFLRIRMGSRPIEVETRVIRQTLEEYFRAQCPELVSLNDVEITLGSKIEIGVSIAPLEEEAREALYVDTEKHLQALLRERFGYTKDFHLIVKI